MPASAAALAPGKAIIESVWPAKVSPRSTISQPTTPDMTATMLPASSALTMKWYSSTWLTSCARFQPSCGLDSSAGMDVSVGVRGAIARWVCVTIVMERGRLGLAHYDQAPIGGPQDLDGHAVEPRQALAGNDLLDRPLDGAAGGKVDDPVEVGQQRVDIVGD